MVIGMDIIPELLTVREAANLLSISEPMLRRMIESHLIPLYRITGTIRFDRQDVLEYIKKNRTPDGGVDAYIARHKSHRK